MKTIRTILCLVLSLATLVTVCTAASPPTASTDDTETPIEVIDSGILPRNNYIILDASISTADLSWTQPAGYTSYRLWVDNTTNQAMTVTVRYKKNLIFNKSYTLTIPKKSNKSYVVNDAVSGVHTVSFSTDTGTVSGIIRVRVSDTAL